MYTQYKSVYIYLLIFIWLKYGYVAMVEWYGEGKAGVLGEKFVLELLCPPKIPQKLAWGKKTRTSDVKRRRKGWYWLDTSYRSEIRKFWTEI
jgi:hypothetical protein